MLPDVTIQIRLPRHRDGQRVSPIESIMPHELRFWAERRDGKRTVSYAVILDKGELYVIPRGQDMFKVSLHKSGAHQVSHLPKFWEQVSDGGSRHVSKWQRATTPSRESTRLYRIVLPAREMELLAPVGNEDRTRFTVVACGDDDVCEIQIVYVNGFTPPVVRLASPTLQMLAAWPFEQGSLIVVAELGPITDNEIALIASTVTTPSDVGITEGGHKGSVVRRFIDIENNVGVSGLMEIRDWRRQRDPQPTFKRGQP